MMIAKTIALGPVIYTKKGNGRRMEGEEEIQQKFGIIYILGLSCERHFDGRPLTIKTVLLYTNELKH